MVEVGNGAGIRVRLEVLPEPLDLRVLRPVRVQADDVPAAGIEAVIGWCVVPIVEVPLSVCYKIFMIADRRVGNGAEAPEGVLRRVPVEELGRGPTHVDVAQIEEHVRVPRVDHIDNKRGTRLAACPVAGSGKDERLT